MRILKINSLPTAKTWLDRDTIMLHACFQILQDAIEKEHVDTHSDSCEEHKARVDEVRALYAWWMERKEEIHAGDNGEDDVDNAMLLRLMAVREFLWT